MAATKEFTNQLVSNPVNPNQPETKELAKTAKQPLVQPLAQTVENLFLRPFVSWRIDFNTFPLGTLICSGFFADTYRCQWKYEDVVIKKYKEIQASEKYFKSELRTMIIASQCSYLMPLKGYSLNPNVIMMKWMPGGDLHTHFENSFKTKWGISWSRRIEIALDVAKGLSYLHQAGIIHGDIKANNILLSSESDTVKLSDYGCSIEENAPDEIFSHGTLRWDAPEVFQRNEINENQAYRRTKKTDIWSFGMLLWEIAKGDGSYPYTGYENDEIITLIKDCVQETIPDNCPKAFADLILSCWGIDPSKRPDIDAIIRSLESINQKINFYETQLILAKQNLPIPQHAIAVMLLEGIFVPKDEKTAADWARKAASMKNDYPLGKTFFADMLMKGQGVPKDEKQAAELYCHAAHDGDLNAKIKYADILCNGQGFYGKNEQQAFALYQEVSELGHAIGQFKCAEMLMSGQGVVKDIKQAVELYTKAAIKNQPWAQYKLAEILEQGLYVPKNEQQALEWYRNSAANGYTLAQNALGEKFLNGQGVLQDKKLAAEWFYQSAEQNDPIGQYRFGNMLVNGDGIPQNNIQGIKWFRKAANQNHPKAQARLALWLCKSNALKWEWDLSRNEWCRHAEAQREAFQWAQKAAAQGEAEGFLALLAMMMEDSMLALKKDVKLLHELFQKLSSQNFSKQSEVQECLPEIQYKLGKMLLCDQDVEQGVEQKETIEKKAFEYFQNAAEQGNKEAQCQLGKRFLFGKGVAKDEKKAAEYFHKAALQDNKLAQFILGKLLLVGQGVEKNEKEAAKWLEAASEKYKYALTILAEMHEHGQGIEKNINKAAQLYYRAADSLNDDHEKAKYYKKAGELGHAWAQYVFANRLLQGSGVKKDVKEAAEWFLMAGMQGLVDAQCEFAYMQKEGQGVAKDKKQAFEWYYRASEAGAMRAKLCVAKMLEKGDGTAKDEQEAFKRYKEVEYLGLSKFRRARMLESGRGIEKDVKQAVELYRDSGSYFLSNFSLAYLLENGLGVLKDTKEANRLYKTGDPTMPVTSASERLCIIYNKDRIKDDFTFKLVKPKQAIRKRRNSQ